MAPNSLTALEAWQVKPAQEQSRDSPQRGGLLQLLQMCQKLVKGGLEWDIFFHGLLILISTAELNLLLSTKILTPTTQNISVEILWKKGLKKIKSRPRGRPSPRRPQNKKQRNERERKQRVLIQDLECCI